MTKKLERIKQKLWSYIVNKSKQKFFYTLLYRSYWHYLFFKSTDHFKSNTQQYFTAIPNYGGGIGHQMANWIAGFWFAKQFNLTFAYSPFSGAKWDTFLGFGENETTLHKLVKDENYKKVKLPLFEEDDITQVTLIQKIIQSYSGEKVAFVCEQDQFYRDQFGVINEIQEKFYNAPSRKKDKLIFDSNVYNIAIHVRRGDILAGQNINDNHTMRWLTNDYFVTVLKNTLDYIKTDKKVNIYFFSQGEKKDFNEFDKFSNLTYCLDMGAMDSFLHMVMADVLIISKSSFSYKPALLNRGIKVCPDNFWHGYPDTKDFILVNDSGNFNINLLNSM